VVVAQFSVEEQYQIDSMNLIINNPASHDTSMVSAYVGLSEILYISNIDTLKYLCVIAESMAIKALKQTTNKTEILSLKKSLAAALNNIGYVYQNQGQIEKSLEYHHKSLKIKEEIGNKSGVATSLKNIGYVYQNQGQIEKSLEYFHKSLKIEEEIGNKSGIAASLNNIGYVYQNQGQIEKSLEYFHKSLKIREEIGNKPGVATSLNNIGYVYQNQGQIEKSLEYFHKSLKIEEEIGNKSGIAASLNNIGYVYQNQGQIEKALAYYHKSLKIKEEIGDKSGIAISLNNIGYVYKNQGQNEKALEYFHKSLKIEEEIGNKSGIAVSLNNIGIVYDRQGQIEKSLEYHHKSLKIKEEIGDKSGIAASLNNIGTIYLNQEQTEKAKEYCAKAYKLTQELGSPDLITKVTGQLYKIAQKQGNYKEAFAMYQLHIEMRDSINSEATYKATIQQQSQYEYAKQFTADSIVNAAAEKVHLANLAAEEAKSEKQALEVAAQKKQKRYLYIGLGLVALFGVFMFNRFKITQKQKNVIDEQKQEVEQQKITVEHTLKELESTHEQLAESHKEITDSINYAERIQRSFLASKDTLDTHLKDYFVFFQPKEVVSGDFYWAAELDDNNFGFSVADSTGHGVPGAIMSLLNITSLEKSIETEIEPHKILNKTREIIVNRLHNDGSEHGGKDGMDCNLMVLNKDRSVLTFASANNTIIIIRNGEVLEFKGDKMPVGKHDRDTDSFTLQSVQLQKGDLLYALTDGFQDQFGGPRNKKYMIKNLKNKFLEIAKLPMAQQEKTLDEEFASWMGKNEQIDDVCIIGVRI
jgi:tetratricopeptide (TPR) repeat protein